MSFDLLFYLPEQRPDFKAELILLFSSNPRFETGDDQALFENQETDVHFQFEYGGEAYLEEVAPPDLILLLNFLRPTPFAEEAAHEIDKLVDKFGLLVLDPQEYETAPQPWDRERFISTYIEHAGRAFRAVWASDTFQPEEKEAMEDLRVPREDLLRAWEWNYKQDAGYEWLDARGQDLFIPKFQFIALGHDLYSMFVWSDAVPAIMPRTSHVLIYRSELAWRPAFSILSRKPTFELVPFDVVEALVGDHYGTSYEWPDSLIAKNEVPPPELEKTLRNRKPGQDAINRLVYENEQRSGPEEDRTQLVGFSQLLDQEFFE